MLRSLILILILIPIFSSYGESTGIRGRVAIKRKARTNKQELLGQKWDETRSDALDQKRAALILNIKKFLADAKDEAQKAELNLRLASLYMEDYRSKLARDPKLKKVDDGSASLKKARSIYNELLARYPHHPRRDEMLYHMGQASMDSGKPMDGVKFFERLIAEAPKSKLVPDAILQIGDTYFDNNKFGAAEKYFDKLIAKRPPQLISYATYRKAWCAYNQGRIRESVNLFKWVINFEEASEARNTRLKTEALVDICNPLVELNAADEAIALFQMQEENPQRRGLASIAHLLSEKGQYPKAIKVYELLLRINPNYQDNPRYELGIVEALKLSHNPKAAVDRLVTQLPRYLENSNWFEIQSVNPKVIQQAKTDFEEVTRKFSLEIHAEGQKTHNEEQYKKAEALYSKYLEYFPKYPQSSEIRFNLAEIQYRRQNYPDASENYYLVYQDKNAKKYHFDAIHNAVLALDRQINVERKQMGLTALTSKSVAKLKDEGEPVKSPYSPTETRFIELAREYLKAYPNVKDAPDVLYQRAYVHYTHADFADALLAFEQGINKYAGHPTSYGAATLTLDIYNRQKDYTKLVQVCQKYLGIKKMNRPDFRRDVSDVLRRSELKLIQLVEEKGNYKEAAEKYLAYTKNYGDQDAALFEKALYNAAVNFTRASLMLPAAEAQEQFLRRFPNSKLKESVLLEVAKTYEALGNFGKAAQYFDTFCKTYPGHAMAKPALRLAGLYYWASNNLPKAESYMWQYMGQYPNDAKGVEQNLLELYRFSGNSEKIMSFWDKKRNQHGVTLENYVVYTMRLAELSARLEGGRFPGKVLDQVSKPMSRVLSSTSNPQVAEAVSKYFLLYANYKRKKFESISLTGNPTQMARKLQLKIALLKELDKDYTRIVGMGHPDTGLSAIYRLASVYAAMANEVQQAPVPGELSGEELETYRNELNRQMVQPFLEKAQNLSEQCLDKSQEFHLYSHWSSKCYAVASQLNPGRYPAVLTFFVPSYRLGVILPGQDAKYEVGKLRDDKYPYESTPLFQQTALKRVEDLMATAMLYDDNKYDAVFPKRVIYRNLWEDRQETLNSRLNRARPSDPKRDGYSFVYLNLLRTQSPDKAIVLIRQMLERFPADPALVNLLGLAYFEVGDLGAAKAVWLSLLNREKKEPAVLNNLGVIASLIGEDNQALGYFQEASGEGTNIESLVNLGFLSLKYHNGVEAKKAFEKVLSDLNKGDAMARTGLGIAQIQNREFDYAKDTLKDASGDLKDDVLAHLAYAYLLMESEKDKEAAQKVLSALNQDDPTIGKDVLIREALDYSSRSPASMNKGSGELPEIDE